MSLVELNSKFDETQWGKLIGDNLYRKLDVAEDDFEIPSTIFAVPKALMLSDPDSYTPQKVAIGPYHRLRPQLYEMERRKVASAKRNEMELHNTSLKDIVFVLKEFEPRIRNNYQMPLSCYWEALCCMMAVDASFLFEFLQCYGGGRGGVEQSYKVLITDHEENASRLGSDHLSDLSRINTTAHNTILRDIIMLENQIPLFVMNILLEFRFPRSVATEMLIDMLVGLSQELSPFLLEVTNLHKFGGRDYAHLLDFLYKFIVRDHVVLEIQDHMEKKKNDTSEKPKRHVLERIIVSKPVEVIGKIQWTPILSKIPGLNVFKDCIEQMVSATNESSSNNSNKPPLQEEIAIPSVTELLEAGVEFKPTTGDISTISFSEKTKYFFMPPIKLDANSAVVLRNLVAYEACTASEPLLLARYTELMNGIIDTDVDAMILCRRGIIINHLKSFQEVADLWNGMSKSVRVTKVPAFDEVIAKVNKYYNGRSKVKFKKFMKKYAWRIFTFLAALMALALMSIQAFCQVYNCSRIARIESLSPL